MKVRALKLKEEVLKLFTSCNGVVGKMLLVDALQHLGIDHNFESQIDGVLSEILNSEFSNSSLHEVALRFRLLREHGHWVSPDVFKKFKDEDGNFKLNTTNEPRGLLSLYNAAHLLIHGEPALEEAITFAGNHLESMMGSLKSPLAEQVKRSLHLPLPRTYRRVEAVHYISEYHEEDGHNAILLELAKLDFNLLQHVHLNELKAMTEWWKELSGSIELSYVRDRVVENYFWSFAAHHEECFGLARMIFAKINVLLTIMDDTYDEHATIEECRMLNEAAQRWDESAISLLPEYLKRFYTELLRNIKEMGDEMAITGNYEIAYIKKQLQKQFSYYLQEAEWAYQNHKPSFDDKVKLGVMTVAVPTISVCGLVAMGDAMPKEVIEWVFGVPDAVIAGGKIYRLMNDISAFTRGKSKGDAPTSVECYMSEHGVTSEVAISKIESVIEDGWRSLNQARFGNRVLLPAVQRIINFALSSPLYYGGGHDAFRSSSRLRKTMETLFVKPIPI
ncbi:alpha-copaene synthase-like [Lolium rigidum]|uniref:alpha-copaene synthase-like n=1 Tax=Lolium rigidum TaxID=89674 RepID=UPI001F5CF4EB|nr:alpha-copaene synthase-like [Lolium rigidum]